MAKNLKNEENEKKGSRRRVGSIALDVFLCMLGTFMYAAGVVLFINPLKFVPGGVTTLAILINYLVPVLPIGMLVFLINVPLFIMSWKAFGWKFIGKTVGCSALLSIFIDALEPLTKKYGFLIYHGDEKLLAAIFGGILMGSGLGIVFLRGATTGGTDIVGRLLRLKFPHVPVGKLVMMGDLFVVVLAGLIYRSLESVLFSLVIVFLDSLAVDYIVSGRNHSKMVLIMSSDPEAVMRDIMTTLGRGVSVFDVTGGYTGEEKKMLMCVVRAHEVAHVRQIIEKYDEKPFIIISDSSEVLGEGFKSYKDTL